MLRQIPRHNAIGLFGVSFFCVHPQAFAIDTFLPYHDVFRRCPDVLCHLCCAFSLFLYAHPFFLHLALLFCSTTVLWSSLRSVILQCFSSSCTSHDSPRSKPASIVLLYSSYAGRSANLRLFHPLPLRVRHLITHTVWLIPMDRR